MTEEINRRFSILDQVESTVSASLARCALLRQAILKRAFEGRLVPAPS
jgi:type I restriction enzyme S subunit